MATVSHTHRMLSLEQAFDSAPSLASLHRRIRDSQRCLEWIQPALPLGLRKQIKAGPIQGTEWCLLVTNASVSTKVRHLVPVLLTVLSGNGAQVNAIRIKVQASGR
jgi:hypothetical protein